jgi:surfactin synthase thioesterase subunit
VQLLSFPYAGGNAFSYRELGEHLPSSIALTTAELPGRGARTGEPTARRMTALVDGLFAEWSGKLTPPYGLYGHSMGAIVAYEFAQRAAAQGRPPVALIVSGRQAPSIPELRQRYLLPSPEFRAMLRDLGGCPPAVLESPELMDYFEPILRADFEVVETHVHTPRPPLDVPIVVAIGDDDDTSVANAQQWERETTCGIELVRFSGDHFFIHRHWPDISGLIRRALIGVPEPARG